MAREKGCLIDGDGKVTHQQRAEDFFYSVVRHMIEMGPDECIALLVKEFEEVAKDSRGARPDPSEKMR